jgi:RNA polymerase sigma factor (sigma-70 family)
VPDDPLRGCPADPWQHYIDGLRRGAPDVVRAFWVEYGPALERLARSRLAPQVQRRVGPDDVVQSAVRTFLRRAGGDNPFQLDDTEALWNLLCAITLTKVREKVRFHRRLRRGVDREVLLGASDDSFAPAAGVADRGPPPEDAVEFADQFDHLLESLDPEEWDVLRLKLDGLTNDEAAEQLGTSERTVRRLVKRLQSRLGRAFPESAP